MKNFLYPGMLVVTVLFSRCGNIPESAGTDSLWDDRTVEVATSTVPCDDEALLTGGMEISGDRVVMYNISQPDLFGCFRLRNDSLVFVAPLQKRGNGPYEALMSQAVFMPECDGLFLIDRQTGRKAFRIDSADPEKWSDVKSWRAFELPNKPNLMSIVPTDCSGGFIAQLLDDRRHMFCTFRSGDSTVAPLSIPYPEVSEGCPDISLGIACRGTLQKRKSGICFFGSKFTLRCRFFAERGAGRRYPATVRYSAAVHFGFRRHQSPDFRRNAVRFLCSGHPEIHLPDAPQPP